MKKDMPRRKLANDLIDCIPDEPDPNSVVEIPIHKIQPYHDHPFHLYTGDRLTDMVDSILTYGVLSPCIVQRLPDGKFEMLAGHNRLHAAEIAGLTTIPALVKENLTDSQAWEYVVETNLRQRSFFDLCPSEQAAVLALQYSRMANQGKRSDIQKELDILEGKVPAPQEGKRVRNSRNALAREYNMSGSSVARLLRVNYLIPEFKQQLDSGKMLLTHCVEISYMSEEEQTWLRDYLAAFTYRMDQATADALHERSRQGGLTRQALWDFLDMLSRERQKRPYKKVRVSTGLYQKYFRGQSDKEVEETVKKALEQYFQNNPGQDNHH